MTWYRRIALKVEKWYNEHIMVRVPGRLQMPMTWVNHFAVAFMVGLTIVKAKWIADQYFNREGDQHPEPIREWNLDARMDLYAPVAGAFIGAVIGLQLLIIAVGLLVWKIAQ